MPQAKDLVDEYAAQESAEADETLVTRVEFISESGIAEDAISFESSILPNAAVSGPRVYAVQEEQEE